MAKILILIGAHLCTAPRPQKEAETLANACHDITVCGLWYDPLYAERDLELTRGRNWQFRPVIDFRSNSLVSRGRSLSVRARNRFAREVYMRFGKFTPSLLGYGVGMLLREALAEKADLTIVHSEAGLWVGGRLIDSGLRVGVDFEDWFSEDLLPEARKSRPVLQLKSLEHRLMQDCVYRLTTSQALASALSEAYNAPKPSAVYNTFPFAERQSIDGKIRDRHDLTVPSLHWFSQTIGPGRGLEVLFQSLQYLSTAVEIHLRGNCTVETKRWIESLVPEGWQNRLYIHPTVGNAELLSRISEHDIGLALEIPYCFSRNLTITNKLFQYLQAGLAVIETDTQGQREVMLQCPDAGEMVKANEPESLAFAITSLVSNKERLLASKRAALKAAREVFSWEGESEVLLREAEKALDATTATAVKVRTSLFTAH